MSFCPTIVLLLVCAMAALSGEGRPEGERLDRSLPGEGQDLHNNTSKKDSDDIHKDIPKDDGLCKDTTGGVAGGQSPGCDSDSGGSTSQVLPAPPEQAIVPLQANNEKKMPAAASNEEPQMQQHGLRKRGAEEVLKTVDDFCRAELKVINSRKTTEDMRRVASERLVVLQGLKAKGRELQAKMSDAPATERAVEDKSQRAKKREPANKERLSQGPSMMSDQ